MEVGMKLGIQLLHQGTADFCVDIIFSPSLKNILSAAQANSQAKLFSRIKKNATTNKLESINGHVPVNFFELKNLSLPSLGFLLATWEHRVFITAAMLEINPFDQFGVKAGKIETKSFLEMS